MAPQSFELRGTPFCLLVLSIFRAKDPIRKIPEKSMSFENRPRGLKKTPGNFSTLHGKFSTFPPEKPVDSRPRAEGEPENLTIYIVR